MIKIDTNLVQRIHDYLMSKPMTEVENLIIDIRSLKPETQEPATSPLDALKQ